MLQNVTKFQWSSKRERAALLVSQDELSDAAIAREIGITRMTLVRWKEFPEFKSRVQQNVERIREKLLARGIREKQNRLNALDDRQRKMTEVIKQRAVEYADVSGGGSTGLLVKRTKSIGAGDNAEIVEEYAVDTGLLKELREHEKQAAQEVGEWSEKHDVSFDFSGLSDEEVRQLAEIRAKLNS